MSKLFREMQEAESHSVERPATSAALAELLTVVGAEAQTARQAISAPLLNCESVQIAPMHRPVLLAADEHPSTHVAFESYRALRTKLTRFQSTQGIRSVVVSSAVSGEGKTTSAVNLAMSMAQLETQRVLLIDGDIRTAGLSGLMGLADKKGLSEVLAGSVGFDQVVLSTNIPRLFTVTAGELLSAASDLFAGSRWKEFIGYCNEIFDMVIVDCPPILGLADFDLISSACDGVLIVVRARKTKRETLTEMTQHLQAKKVLGIVLNGQERRPTNYYGSYYYSRAKGKA
jgi:capsular exopolysaccharide synthesis family protein